MPREDAADDSRVESLQPQHHPQGSKSHILQSVQSSLPFVKTSKRLDGVANFGVGGEFVGFDPTVAKTPSGLLFGPVVFGFFAKIKKASCFVGYRTSQF
jgi:hypothetical protein